MSNPSNKNCPNFTIDEWYHAQSVWKTIKMVIDELCHAHIFDVFEERTLFDIEKSLTFSLCFQCVLRNSSGNHT